MDRFDRIRRMRITLIILILLFAIFSSQFLSRMIILVAFVMLNFIFAFVKKRIPKLKTGKYFYGVEIIMFCTVLTSVAFGSRMGLAMGGLLMVVNYIAERRLSRYFMVTTILYSVIGYSSWYFNNLDIVSLGIYMTLFYNAAAFILVSLLGANKKTMLVFSMVNIWINVLLFTSLARPVLALIR